MSTAPFSARRAHRILAACILLVMFSGCSLPKIIILNDPLSAAEHDNLGRIYESQGKFDLAVQQYKAALNRDPKSLPSLLLLGDLSFKIKNYSEAESSYEKAGNLQPDNGDIYNDLCWVYLEQNVDLQKAAALIEKAMTTTPDHRAYYLDTQGMVLLRQGNVAEAIAAFHEAIELLPKDNAVYLSATYTHLAEAYRAAGDPLSAGKAEQAAERYRVRK
jgi:tetratricopeptide (TPR) repeat protein